MRLQLGQPRRKRNPYKTGQASCESLLPVLTIKVSTSGYSPESTFLSTMDLLYPAKENVGNELRRTAYFLFRISHATRPIYWNTLFSFLQLELKPSRHIPNRHRHRSLSTRGKFRHHWATENKNNDITGLSPSSRVPCRHYRRCLGRRFDVAFLICLLELDAESHRDRRCIRWAGGLGTGRKFPHFDTGNPCSSLERSSP